MKFPIVSAVDPTVGDLKASPLNDTAIRVSWTKPRPEDQFKDEYHVTISIQGYMRTITTNNTSIIVGNMDLSKMNDITVQAVWANGTVVTKSASTSVQMPSTGNLSLVSAHSPPIFDKYDMTLQHCKSYYLKRLTKYVQILYFL
ncbi:unnamed protein product [Dibothriocephalus latus]|uniref:Fibronectin type-III domain-containing protein n=1 Tax=Dibothriocephalus latus TaxID=60516 RepID=A0A3P7LSF7_DIBLA|nr:unnamed protein product [Dibothriocephalus latus]